MKPPPIIRASDGVLYDYDAREHRQASCEGKQSYTDRTLADTVAALHHRKGHRSTVYRCPFCNGWHVGTPRKKVVKNTRKQL